MYISKWGGVEGQNLVDNPYRNAQEALVSLFHN